MEAWLQEAFCHRERAGDVGAAAVVHGPDARAQPTVFFALLRVEELRAGLIRPHDRTHPGPKEDRLRLTGPPRNLSPSSPLPDPDGAAQEHSSRAAADERSPRPMTALALAVGEPEAIAASRPRWPTRVLTPTPPPLETARVRGTSG